MAQGTLGLLQAGTRPTMASIRQPGSRCLSHYAASPSRESGQRCCALSRDQPEYRGNVDAQAEPDAEPDAQQTADEPAQPPRPPLQSRLAESEVHRLTAGRCEGGVLISGVAGAALPVSA